MPQLTIRNMTSDDLNLVVKWAQEEGWSIEMTDVEAYLAQGEDCFKLLLLDDIPIGALSIVKHSNNFAFIGLFLVNKDFRNLGYGKYIWNECLKDTPSNPISSFSFGLCAVSKQIPRYSAYGFNSLFGFSHYKTKSPDSVSTIKIQNINTFDPSFFNKVIQYDSMVFYGRRENFLSTLLKTQGVKAFLKMEEDNIVGYGIIRNCNNGFRIGPLFANDFETAKSLMEKLLNSVANTNKKVILDSPSLNKYLVCLAEYFKLEREPENDTQLMIKGDLPYNVMTNIEKNYAIASLEMG